MSTRKVTEGLEDRVNEQIEYLGTLANNTDDYKIGVEDLTKLGEQYRELVVVSNEAEAKEREHELNNIKAEIERLKAEKEAENKARELELEAEKLKLEKEKAEAEKIRAFEERQSRERGELATLKENHDQFMLKTIVDSTLHIVDTAFLGGFLNRGFTFEETGTYGSQTFREVIKRLPFPGKKK